MTYLPFEFQKTNENKPLRIAVTDDTPNGSGKEIRDNLWLAAITAAMLRNNALHGVKISVEFQGDINGPSAGAVSCLAILSAIDGLSLPDDFAMTGTIFPDGTIGDVGGIVEKIIAAAKAGKKRIFVPGYRRMIEDASGKLIDIINLAEKLNIAIFPVGNIEEAFAFIYNKSFPEKKYINEKSVTAISRDAEELFKKEYTRYLAMLTDILKKIPEESVNSVCTMFNINFGFEKLFREGKFTAAIFRIIEHYAMFTTALKTLQVHKKWQVPLFGNAKKVLAKIHKRNFEFATNAVYRLLDEHENKLQKTLSTSPDRHPSPISAQLEDPENVSDLLAAVHALNSHYESIKNLHLSKEQFENEKLLELFLLQSGELAAFSQKDKVKLHDEIAGTLPHKQPNPAASKVENLFKTAQVATKNAAFSEFPNDEYREDIEINEYLAATISDFALKYHNDIASNPTDYHTQVSLKLQVSAFVKSTVLLVRKYRDISTDFAQYLIRNARESALKNLQECFVSSIPSLEPIRAFQIAESIENSQDNLEEILEDYWYSALYAKALLISFK